VVESKSSPSVEGDGKTDFRLGCKIRLSWVASQLKPHLTRLGSRQGWRTKAIRWGWSLSSPQRFSQRDDVANAALANYKRHAGPEHRQKKFPPIEPLGL
jgi:hypothetical protein